MRFVRALSPALRRFGRRIARDERGSSAIEFAVLGPVLLILILGTVEVALDMIADASVQYAAQQASRVGLTTTSPSSGTRVQQAQSIVNNILHGWTKVGGVVTTTLTAYSTYNAVGTTTTQTDPAGGLGDVVTYKITLKMPPFSGIPRLFGISSMTFSRSYLVQNEK